MANTLTEVAPKLLAQGLMALRQIAIMPLLVNRQYESMAGQRGSTIDVPIPSAITAQAVAPANVPPSTADVSPTSVAVPLDQWYEAPFYMTDKDILSSMNGTIPMQASEAIKSLANNVDSYLLGMYTKFYGYQGTAGTTPFLSSGAGITDVTRVRAILNNQLAPMDDRRIVLNPDAEANALENRAFHDMSFTGQNAAILRGEMQQKLGFGWFMDQNVPVHTAGTITTGLAAKTSTAQAAGLTAIVCTTAASTGACALVEGDIITFAGDSQTYVLTADATQASASTDVTLKISPPLKVALEGDEAVTVKDSHVVNLAFHRDAIAFATRPLQNVEAGLGAITRSAVDPVSGLTLRLEITREHKRTRWSYDILYGGTVIRPEFGARIAG